MVEKTTKEKMIPLSENEWTEWTKLTKRIKYIDGKIPEEAFYAFCESFVSAVIDLVPYQIKNGELEILLIYRKDRYYDGFHIPGSVIVPGKTSKETLNSVIDVELGKASLVSKIDFVDIVDSMKGEGSDLDKRGQDLKLLYVCRVDGEVTEGEWFTKNNLPKNIIPEHQKIALEIFDFISKL